jgi:hypothetical protein
MDLDPQLPPLSTLTRMTNTQTVPPDNPPDPPTSSLFPENIPTQPLANPTRGPPAKRPGEAYEIPLPENLTEKDLESAVQVVVAVLERGYHPYPGLAPINTAGWAKMACTVLAAMGRGYSCLYTAEWEAEISRARAEATDPNPLPNCPTYFHRLSTITDTLVQSFRTPNVKSDTNTCLVSPRESPAQASPKCLALVLASSIPPPRRPATRGRDTIMTRSRSAALSQDRASAARDQSVSSRDRVAPTRDRSSSPKRARASTLMEGPVRMRVDSPTASPGAPTPTRSPNTPKPGLKVTPPASAPGPPSLDAIMTAMQTAIGAALTTAMAPYAAKLEALEKAVKPTPATRQRAPVRAPAAAPIIIPTAQPRATGSQVTPPPNLPHANAPVHRDAAFTLVNRQNKGKGKEKAGGVTQPTQPNSAPISYAKTAASAANTQQPQTSRKVNQTTPTVTEVTVIRDGGFLNCDSEGQIRSRAADAIVREVRYKMARAVAKPIPLRAGRWSIHPRSKGNFVYSFEGDIPFSLIQSYKRLLLDPFFGSGELCPSMGWTRFLVHGVPIWDEENFGNFTSEAILEEVRTMPGLKKATFAMQPRWLKPLDNVESLYSSITFALSDPSGKTTSTLLNGRAALFGKEVTVRKWVDKPALIQCSRCHALGHNRSSKTCQLSKDSVKCYKCGLAHRSESHDQHCSRKHAVAGICDCQNFKCLNCHNRGHNCRDVRCPARDLYRTKGGKGKGRATDPPTGLNQNADSGPSRHPLPLNPPQPPLTQIDFDRMDDFARTENERMDWEREQIRDAVDNQEARDTPMAYEVPLTEVNVDAQAAQHRGWSPSQPLTHNNPPIAD